MITTVCHRRFDGNPADQVHAGVGAERLAPTFTEDGEALPVRGHELAHVLDDAQDPQVVLSAHGDGPRRD